MRHPAKAIHPVLFQFLAAVGGLFFCSAIARAQELTVHFSIVSIDAPARIRVEGTFPQGSAIWSFRNAYGRAVGLGDRIQNLSLADSNDNHVGVRQIASGEFKGDNSATHFRYEVRLAETANPADASHVSGLNSEYGLLMLADLLPKIPAKVRIGFQLPDGWAIASSLTISPSGWYDVPDVASTVFLIGHDLKETRKRIGSTDFRFVTSGDWPFPGDAVARIAARIIGDHSRHTGYALNKTAVLMLAPYSGSFGAERWSAETRGSTTVLLLGRNSTRNSLLPRLSIVLTHELFHLWVPNALSLDGDYDWFFEGFTLYQALCSAMRLGFIGFQEYLNTLARVYDSYLATEERDRFSLVEASRRRWTDPSSLVYDKGMLLAFLYDLRFRVTSRNRFSLDDVYRELFRRFPVGASRAEGNKSITSVLEAHDGDKQFSRSYIEGLGAIELEKALPPLGIKVWNSGGRHSLVVEAVSNEQQALLRGLGYKKQRH